MRDVQTTLDTLGIRHNCDKSSVARSKGATADEKRPGHDFLRKYEFFVSRFRSRENFRLLELGIGPDWNMGASLRIWLDYFDGPGLAIHMADINPNARQFASDRVKVSVGDLGDPSFRNGLAKERYDLIVDDASHLWSHQVDAFLALFPALSDGGVYILEDIHTSFGGMRDSYSGGSDEDAFSMLAGLALLVTGRGAKHPATEAFVRHPELNRIAKSIDSVSFVGGSCIICKRPYY